MSATQRFGVTEPYALFPWTPGGGKLDRFLIIGMRFFDGQVFDTNDANECGSNVVGIPRTSPDASLSDGTEQCGVHGAKRPAGRDEIT